MLCFSNSIYLGTNDSNFGLRLQSLVEKEEFIRVMTCHYLTRPWQSLDPLSIGFYCKKPSLIFCSLDWKLRLWIWNYIAFSHRHDLSSMNENAMIWHFQLRRHLNDDNYQKVLAFWKTAFQKFSPFPNLNRELKRFLVKLDDMAA